MGLPMGTPPQTPADIDVFYENGQYVFRADESRALYVYDGDRAGKPTCEGACLQEWQPLIASANSQAVAEWTLVKRSDSTQQWRYRNRPVYVYLGDRPGQDLGDGRNGQWHVVTP